MNPVKTIIAIMALMILSSVMYTTYKFVGVYDEYVLLKSQSKGIKAERDYYQKLLKESDCDDEVERAVDLEKRRNDNEDKVNNPTTGIISIPFGMHER